jgi:vancomycin resistance protein VanJ
MPERVRRLGVLGFAVWGFLFAILCAAVLLHVFADRWWLGTVLAFSPRWMVAWPLGVLLPFVIVWRRRLLWPIAATVVVIFWPIMGWETPSLLPTAEGVADFRILTCNVGGGHVEAWQFPLLITRYSPDVMLLQECPGEFAIDWPAGWTETRAGSLVVASRMPLKQLFAAENHYPPSQWPPVNGLVCEVESSAGKFSICNLHLRSPREGLATVADRWVLVNPSRRKAVEDEIEYRDAESRDLRARLKSIESPLIVAGDFNMPCESAIYRRHWGDFANGFSERGWGFGYSKATWIGPISFGTRIDHVLSSQRWAVERCWVATEIGSDHLPVIADLRLLP